MTEPIKFNYSVGTTARYEQCRALEMDLCGVRGEVKAEKNGWHAGVGAILGNGVSGDVEIGKKFDINKNWNVDLSAKAAQNTSFLGKAEYLKEINSTDYNLDFIHDKKIPSLTEAGIGVKTNYTTNDGIFTVGAGLAGKYMSNGVPDIQINKLNNNMNGAVLDGGHKSGLVIAPGVSAEVKLGKDSHHSIGLNAEYGFDVQKRNLPNEVSLDVGNAGEQRSIKTTPSNKIFDVGVTYKYTF